MPTSDKDDGFVGLEPSQSEESDEFPTDNGLWLSSPDEKDVKVVLY